jgi:hypothetical protein
LFVFAILFDELSIAAAVYIPLSAAAVLLLVVVEVEQSDQLVRYRTN